MRSVTYSMGVSLDGYIVGPDGDITAPPPDEEVFRFVTDEIRQVGVHLLGRKLYETMLYWETVDQDPSLDDSELEWAAIWKPLPKVVFSTTLSAVQGNARLASAGLAGAAAACDLVLMVGASDPLPYCPTRSSSVIEISRPAPLTTAPIETEPTKEV
jgi:hypothetical protein